MKSFKNYITEEPPSFEEEQFYVTVKNGKAILCSTKLAAPCSSFGSNVVSAILQGDKIITVTKDGKTVIWQFEKQGRLVRGPVAGR